MGRTAATGRGGTGTFHPALPALPAYRRPVNSGNGIGLPSIASTVALIDPSSNRSPLTVNGGSPGPAPTCSTPSNSNVLPVHTGLIGETKRIPNVGTYHAPSPDGGM